ncbi:hypothetical protein G6F26_009029 [Rhizopus arrhizus]|uniref:Uncharacterized protein n=1 Tax=Rhizopus oryzae TaxID=64495 RepID=A0A9P6X250_RHIOR|nr:hypothetical protein G6F23_006437 [Rhizopus arrhizus]KAG1412644.1 hypothetical protein G6F58_007908 [Rhizopus delemar]KAG0757645.1 hypothetical protein G6F24_010345 [Rhizopus arrhizus]KAG0832818.1 hypothetical protein G6F18_007051 [Rhizopus arrhizus]KAG0853807.1 hypothetical protein G6F17_006899 [Rhizopus arrhizus]
MSNESQPLPESASFDIEEYNVLKREIALGNHERALSSFVLLQSSEFRHPTFQAFAAEIVENLDPEKGTKMSKFFASLPFLLQANVLEFARAHMERNEERNKIFNMLHGYITYYPRYAYKYLIEAINMLILNAQKMEEKEKQRSIEILVTDLFARLCKQKLILVKRDILPSVQSTENGPMISLPYHLFEQFLLLGQRFYIKKHKWEESIQFTCTMLTACGYEGLLDESTFAEHTTRLLYLKQHRGTVRVDGEGGRDSLNTEEFVVLATVMCEYMAATSQFVQFGYDYYKAVCGTDNENADEAKSCLIPICTFQPNKSNDKSTVDFADDSSFSSRRKRLRLDYSDEDTDSKIERERSRGLDSYCVKGVDNTLQILSKAGDCLRHVVELWQWAAEKLTTDEIVEQFGSWEQGKVIDAYKLPFDMHNAILLVRSDLALSSPSVPGNLAKALELSQDICDRIDKQRRQEKTGEGNMTLSDTDIPFMFAFRVLYNIGIIYLLVGSLQQSTLEIAIILSVFPIPNELDEKDFLNDEIDCRTVANIFQGREFGLMRVTQEGLVARCIKHLVVGLDNESEQKGGMASIDSALRWDEKAGNMIVMMQYGWPYWNKRTNLWQKVINKISEKRVFKNREFLEYLYVFDVLHAILQVHLTAKVAMDIIPPEFALRGSYRHLIMSDNSHNSSTASMNMGGSTNDTLPTNQDNETIATFDEEDEEISSKRSLPIYQPTFANTIMPSTSMSPSWYSASTQKNSFAKWMSPSFYYSRPATSVILPDETPMFEELSQNEGCAADAFKGMCVPREIVTRCLEYRISKYAPRITPQRMRHVLQRFLKNMILKANEES